MTTIRIDGEPLARFVLEHIPSVNDAIDKARTHFRTKSGRQMNAGSGHTKRWRRIGEKLAREFVQTLPPKIGWLVDKRAFLWVKVYRENNNVYDVTNPYTKALQDGFTDAGVWPDDDWPNLPYALFSWCAWEFEGPPRNLFVIEVHELDAVYHNGVAQALPLGRTKDDAVRMAHADVMELFVNN